MLEPDVALTDFMLAVLCGGFAASLVGRSDGEPVVRRTFAALFATLALASILGGAWHAFFSERSARQLPMVWTLTMLSLGAAASWLWIISSRLASSPFWRRWLALIGIAQFVPFAAVVLFRTQSYAVVGLAMLPPVAVLTTVLARSYLRSRSSRLLLAISGLLLVVGANILQQLHVSLPAAGLSANAL
jgi:hypothetical protein